MVGALSMSIMEDQSQGPSAFDFSQGVYSGPNTTLLETVLFFRHLGKMSGYYGEVRWVAGLRIQSSVFKYYIQVQLHRVGYRDHL